MGPLDDVVNAARGVGATARNVGEYLRYGGLDIEFEYSPYEVVAQAPMYRLRRYFPDDLPSTSAPSLVLVPPLMMMADVYDVAPKASAVRAIHEQGIDVWVVDFGRPEKEPGGMSRTVADHIIAVADVVDVVRGVTGRNVTLSGYSQGGMFSYQATAYRQGDGVDSIVAFGTPVDFGAAPLPTPLIPVSAQSYTHLAGGAVQTGVLPHVAIPRWLIKTATRLTDPVRVAEFQWKYYRTLHDREALLPAEQQRRFLAKEGLTDYPGTALAGLADLVATNRMMVGGQVVGDRVIALADIEAPVLLMLGETDREGHPDAARAIRSAAPRADVYEVLIPVGHFGLVAGNGARRNSWPRVAAWLRWRAGEAELPADIRPAELAPPGRTWTAGVNSQRAQAVVDGVVDVAHDALSSVGRIVDEVSGVAREHLGQLPVVGWIDQFRPDSADTVSTLIARHAADRADAPALFFRDRVVTWRALDAEVEDAVRRLLGVGVRAGERVAVLLPASDEALVLSAALIRLGAIVAPVRQGGDPAAVAPAVLLTDAAGARAVQANGFRGVVTSAEDAPSGWKRLDAVNPARVAIPSWYRRDPQRPGDAVFLLADGPDAPYAAVTRHQWAVLAHAAARAASVGEADTVYLAAPLADPATMLVLLGGALVAHARAAIPSGDDAETFWLEVRRYGVTHAGVDGAVLRRLVTADPDALEKGQPVRTFIGADIASGLGERSRRRFRSTEILHAHHPGRTEGLLVSSRTSPGLLGRAAPGTPEVAVARADLAAGRVRFSPNGTAEHARPEEVGLLLVRAPGDSVGDELVRDAFALGDAWTVTDELAYVDHGGEVYSAGPVRELVETDGGWAAPSVITAALEAIAAVDSAGVRSAGVGELEVTVSLLPGAELNGWELSRAMDGLVLGGAPATVRVLGGVSTSESVQAEYRWDANESAYRGTEEGER
ncbi:AMP-binding protein [Tsukamurella sp. NPDC003166]|uniref:AMP-binding protein n=1 Tax=Tsukamurella sp. NPDC003166 TaxID=3154444 RepID=UPI0033BBC94E